MAESERDSTGEWLLPEARRPPTVAEIEQRVDYAIAVARSAESAAFEIGVAAIDAAEQACRAAELAERASAAAFATNPEAGPGTEVGNGDDDALRHFIERTDRVLTRLQAIGRLQQRVG